jgi:ElaB/YqjD/DUF883 family membrane-anchored ribosome-binding protein
MKGHDMSGVTADLQNGNSKMTDSEINDKLRLLQSDFIGRLTEYRGSIDKIVTRFEASMDKLDRIMEIQADKNENARDKLRNEMMQAHNELEKKLDERGGKAFQYTAIAISMVAALLAVILFFVQHIHLT